MGETQREKSPQTTKKDEVGPHTHRQTFERRDKETKLVGGGGGDGGGRREMLWGGRGGGWVLRGQTCTAKRRY